MDHDRRAAARSLAFGALLGGGVLGALGLAFSGTFPARAQGALTLTSITPNPAPSGSTITLTAENIDIDGGITAVTFGDDDVDADNCTPSACTVTVPDPPAGAPTVAVTLTIDQSTSNPLPFTFGASISSVTPNYSGADGGMVTFTGFFDTTPRATQLSVGGRAITNVSCPSPTTCTGRVPANPQPVGGYALATPFEVTVPGRGTSQFAETFTWYGQPTLTGASSLSAGQPASFQGSGWPGGTGLPISVDFIGTSPVGVTECTPSSCQFVTPSGADYGDIEIITPGGVAAIQLAEGPEPGPDGGPDPIPETGPDAIAATVVAALLALAVGGGLLRGSRSG